MATPLGSTPGIIVGVGVGAAASAALAPAIEVPKQKAWEQNPRKLLDPATLARLIAQGGIPLDKSAYDDAKREGYDTDKLDALVYLSQTVPGMGEALSLWRLGLLTDALFAHVLTKAGLDSRYVQPLIDRKIAEVVGLGDIAYGVVRGILPAPSWVPVPPPTTTTKVKRFPQVDIDPVELAHKLGYDEDMLKLMVGRSGLSMAPIMAANALFRGLIEQDDYELAIAEGDLRTEWADKVRDTARQILTAGQYSEAELRGYSTAAERLKNTAKHGMSKEDSDLLHLIQGRPLAVHQVTTGLARGGKYGGKYTDVPEPYQDAIRQSNIKEPWAGLAYANRYSYPSGFQIRAEAQAGRLSFDEVQQILLEVGWSPHWAEHFATAWTGGTAAASDPHITKAHNQLWTTLHRSYVAEETDDALATTTLTTLSVDAAAIPQVLALWQAERALIRKQLSAAQVKKAYATAALNPDTGSAWTQTDALDALIQRGYSMADATTLLEL